VVRVAVAAALLLVALPARAVMVSGTVFRDANGDGILEAGEPPVPGVAVWLETDRYAVSDAHGRYQLDVAADGIVWTRTPDGYRPAPTWKEITVADGARTVDLGLRPAPRTGPLTFVHASDTHIGVGEFGIEEARRAIRQTAALDPPPAFLTITGDVTQGDRPAEFEELLRILEDVDVPFVPVIGNHDEYDAGVTYREYLGPPQYSFDQGGVHFIVLDLGVLFGDFDAALDFVRRDLALGPRGAPAAVLTHAPLPDAKTAALAELGVGWMFTGHWHANRIVDHRGLVEVNTQTLVFGGTDFTPAGFRVATWQGDHFVLGHHTIVDAPELRVMYPRPGQCVPPGALTAIVAAETGAGGPGATLSLDGGAALALVPQGGWTESAALTVAPGAHLLTATMAGARATSAFCVAPAPPPAETGAAWPQLQGSARHLGVADAEVCAPLSTRWARSVGGHVRAGSPVVAGGRVFVSVADLAGAEAGGLLALDAATGARLWSAPSGHSVANAAAVDGDTVVFASDDGVVHAVSAATGAPIWRHDLGAGLDRTVTALDAAPTISAGRVFIGVQRRFAALDLATGRAAWTVDPSPNGSWMGSFAAAGVGDGVVVAAFARGIDGLVAWEPRTGRPLWRIPRDESDGLPIAINGSFVVKDGTAWLGNGAATVAAVDLVAGTVRWERALVPDVSDFGYAIAATPALAGGLLLVPTQLGKLYALDATTGAPVWSHDAGPTRIRPVHYYGSGTRPFGGSPVVTGETVWIGGADGTLSALDLATGRTLWSEDLGAPILSGPAPSGRTLFVASYDGTVQALAGDCPPKRAMLHP
jgi:outer membrane protein assembly factor BamB